MLIIISIGYLWSYLHTSQPVSLRKYTQSTDGELIGVVCAVLWWSHEGITTKYQKCFNQNIIFQVWPIGFDSVGALPAQPLELGAHIYVHRLYI